MGNISEAFNRVLETPETMNCEILWFKVDPVKNCQNCACPDSQFWQDYCSRCDIFGSHFMEKN